jgi:AraC-like DNA-binding protein
MKAQLIGLGPVTKKSIQIKLIDQKYLATPFHFHEMCELVFIEKSFGKRIVGDHVSNFKEGDLVLMGPNLPHVWLNDATFQHPRSKKSVRSIVIYFPPDFLLNLTDDDSITSLAEELIMRSQRGLWFYGKTQELIIEKINTLMHEKGLKKMLAFLSIVDIMSESNEFHYLASIGYKNSYSLKDTHRLNEIYHYLNKNFTRKITLQDAAHKVNMSPSAFCRFFKLRTQKSFSVFINELRVSYARRLLLNNESSITSIAFECGYQNLTNFNKFFKRITGETPSQFKKQISNPAGR